MNEDDKKKALDIFGSIVAGALAYASNRRADGGKKAQENIENTDPDIARPGELVMAIEDIDGSGINDDIKKGKIYTVNGYHLGSYNLVECGAVYNPYLGEEASQWFAADKFEKVIPLPAVTTKSPYDSIPDHGDSFESKAKRCAMGDVESMLWMFREFRGRLTKEYKNLEEDCAGAFGEDKQKNSLMNTRFIGITPISTSASNSPDRIRERAAAVPS